MLDPKPIPDAESRCHTIGYYVRGHQDKKEFCHSVEFEYGERIDPEKVEHTFFRVVPHSEFGLCLHKSIQGSGAFAVTTIDL